MDKLEPILKQKFWIILGIGVILTFTGWWMATGSLAATITQRKDTLKKVEGSIPSGEVPNNDWSTRLSQINVTQEAMVGKVRRDLWQQQVDTYFWPQNVDEFARDVPYRSEFNLTARELYRTYYPANAEEVWQRVRPISRLDGSGIVMFPLEKMPQKHFGELAPRSEEIWDAQEDLWLLVPILDAIREVNGGYDGTRLDAVLHIIERLELMGGERSQGEAAAGTGAGGLGGSGDPMAAAMAGGYSESGSGGFGGGGLETGPMGGSGGLGTGGAVAAPKLPADFDVKEEFGSTGVASGGAYGGANFFGGGAESAMGSADGDGGGVASTATTIRRYIDDADNLPYKTRGFYLSVVMDHRRVPNLIGELTANGTSPWPIEIVRVQISRLNDDDTEGHGLGAPNMLAGGGGSFGPSGFGSSGVAEETYTPPETTGFNDGAYDPSASGSSGFGPGGMPNPTGGLSFAAALSDPFMAKVSIAGLIYLYKPVDAPATTPETTPATTTDGVPAEAAPTTVEGAAPTPAEGTPTPTEPQPTEPGATPAPAPAATTPEPASEPPAPGDTPPAATAEPPPN